MAYMFLLILSNAAFDTLFIFRGGIRVFFLWWISCTGLLMSYLAWRPSDSVVTIDEIWMKAVAIILVYAILCLTQKAKVL